MKVASKKSAQFEKMDEQAGTYYACSQQEKKLKKDKEDLKPDIIVSIRALGVENDTGDLEVTTNRFTVTHQSRTSGCVSLEKVTKLLMKKGAALQGVVKIRQEKYVDEEELVRLHSNGVISKQELEAVTDNKITFALIVKEKKQL